MAKSSFINKKFFVIALLLVLLVAGGIGLYYILKPKADTRLAFEQVYEVTQSEDYAYVKQRNNKVCAVLASLSTSEESYELTKFQFNSFSSINASLDLHNSFILDHIMFVNDDDTKLVNLQKEMTKSFETLKQSIHSCKTYVDTYLTNQMIESYTTAQLYLRLYNYKPIYIQYITSLTEFYECIGKLFEGYMYETIAVNPLTKANVFVACSWAKKTANLIAFYKDEYADYNFTWAIATLSSFSTRAKNTSVSEYVNNKEHYDTFASTLKKVDLNACFEALAKGDYENYANSLEGEDGANCLALKSYFLG